MTSPRRVTRCAAFLRGINVGTAKRVAMADLRALFADLGYMDVFTVLNSGNVVFTAPGIPNGADVSRIERAILRDLAVTTRVIVLPISALAAAVGERPFGALADNPSRHLLMVLRDRAARAALEPLLARRWDPDALAFGHDVAHLWCADGIAQSPLWSAAHRAVGDAGTARNLATMTRLVTAA